MKGTTVLRAVNRCSRLFFDHYAPRLQTAEPG
jgi:hypothetical protein